MGDNAKQTELRIRFNADEKRAFFETCEAGGYSPSGVVRRLVREWTQKHSQKNDTEDS